MLNTLSKIFRKSGRQLTDERQKSMTSVSLAQFYGDYVPWELPVQYCASDCVRPGDTVFDIGGHIGAVAIALSRMVAGQGGKVYSFEPNREMWPHLLENLAINGIENVSHIPMACFSEGGKLMKFYSEPSFYKAGSSLVRPILGAKTFDVVTIAVDEFCDVNVLHPSFMKIDVEGAEIHVLRSARKLLDSSHLPIIIEYQATEHPRYDDPLVFLEERGYIFFDVNTYSRVDSKSYGAMADLPLVNVFCVHRDSQLAHTYLNLGKTCVFEQQILETERLLVDGISISRGRYIVECHFDCPDDVTAALAVKSASRNLAYYEATGKHLKQHSCSSMVIEVKEAQSLSVELIIKDDFRAGLRKVSVFKIEIGKEVS